MKTLQQIIDILKGIVSLKKRLNLPQSWDFEKEKIDPKDAIFERIFGATDLTGKPSKDWRPYMPKFEPQVASDCVSFSRTNCAEGKALIAGVKDDDNEEIDFSDLDLAFGSGTTSEGNSFRNVNEYARKTGVSMEKDCLYTTNWAERAVRYNLSRNKKKYKMGNWSWVACDTNTLKNALADGPIQIGIGVGYNYQSGGVLKDPKTYQAYHAIVLAYIDENGNKYIYDSYEPHDKVLGWDYKILFAVSQRDLPQDWRGQGVPDADFYQRLIGKLLMRVESHGEVFRVVENYIQKVDIHITDLEFAKLNTERWKKDKVFLGISEKDFARVEKVAYSLGGVKEPEEKINISSLIN